MWNWVAIQNIYAGDTSTVWCQGTGSFISINGLGKPYAEGAVNEIYLHDMTSGYSDNGVANPLGSINGAG
jgi:hypothetical protein